MSAITNYRDLLLDATNPRLILVPADGIDLVGTGMTFEVRGKVTHPVSIRISATPRGRLINQVCTFALQNFADYVLENPSDNIAVIIGNVDGDDSVTLEASITYQGLTHTSEYTINKISDTLIYLYEVVSSVDEVLYDAGTATFTPDSTTGITITSFVSENGGTYTAYAGRYTIQTTTNGGGTWTGQYASASDESSYLYPLTGVTATTTHIRVRLHEAGTAPTETNFKYIHTIPILRFGYRGSESGGKDGRSVYIDTTNNLVSIYDSGGILSGTANATFSVICNAVHSGFTGTPYYKWFNNNTVVSDWGYLNSSYVASRTRNFVDTPQIIRVIMGDGYSGSVQDATDYVTIIGIKEGTTGITILLSNDFHVVPVDENGVYDYTDSGTKFWVYEGDDILTFKEVSEEYPAEADTGKYNVHLVFTKISSGGAVTGMGTTTGTVPDHTNMTAYRANVSFIFRIRRQDGSTVLEQYANQVIVRSWIGGEVEVIGSGDRKFYDSLPYGVDFLDRDQVFWPGQTYNSIQYSGSMAFGKTFTGLGTVIVTQRNKEYFEAPSGTASNPLTLTMYQGTGGGLIGWGCDPFDHPVLYGITTIDEPV